MRVIIYGAGAIGGVVGGHLLRTGQDVALIGRPGHMSAVQQNGLRLVTPTTTHTLSAPAFTTPRQIDFGPADVVFLCMKGQDTEGALRELLTMVEDIPIFCFQNGVRNEEIASEYFPRVYGVKVLVGAIYLRDGEVVARRDPPGWLIVGRYPKGVDAIAETAVTQLRAAEFITMVTPDVMPYKWGKLLRNLGNSIGAITDYTGDEIAFIGRAARQEARDILTRAGIRWVSDKELAEEWPESTSKPRNSIPLGPENSTWQSLARRQGTVEADYLNGEIVRLAKGLGRKAPINEGLLRISYQMATDRERPGKYSPAQLSVMLGLDQPQTLEANDTG